MTRSGVWILLVSLAAPAAAQATGPFDQLAQVIEPGDDVRVTLRGGRVWRVRVVELTSGTLSVLARGTQLDLGEDDVWLIRHRVNDSDKNGAWIGFAAGAAAGMWYLQGFCFSGESCSPQPGIGNFALTGGLFGMVGLWIGVGVDHLIREERVVWLRASSRSRVSVAPLLASDRRGVAVSLSF